MLSKWKFAPRAQKSLWYAYISFPNIICKLPFQSSLIRASSCVVENPSMNDAANESYGFDHDIFEFCETLRTKNLLSHENFRISSRLRNPRKKCDSELIKSKSIVNLTIGERNQFIDNGHWHTKIKLNYTFHMSGCDESMSKTMELKLKPVRSDDVEYILSFISSTFPNKSLKSETDLNIKLLLGLGAQKEQLLKLISRCPGICNSNTSKTILPKFFLLFSYGMTFDQVLESMISHFPLIFRSTKHIQNILTLLSNHTGIEPLVKIVISFPSVLSKPISTLSLQIKLLEQLGVESVAVCLIKYPKLLMTRPSEMHAKASCIRRFLGYQFIGTLIQRSPRLLGSKLITMVETFAWLEDKFDLETARRIVEIYPLIFTKKVSTISLKVDFICNVMGRSLAEIVKMPNTLGYSLNKRIKPRYERLKALGRADKFSMNRILSVSDEKFRLICERNMQNEEQG